jgi:hypothetical protein
MTATLRVGNFEADGKLTAGSMSAAIESAINALVKPGAGEDPRGRRILARAIAYGVLRHLSDNQSAFQVAVPNVSGSTKNQAATIAIDLGTTP